MNFELITKFAGIESVEDLLIKYSEFQREPARNDDMDPAVLRRKQEIQHQKQLEKNKEIALQKRRQQELGMDQSGDNQKVQNTGTDLNRDYSIDAKKQQDQLRGLQEEETYEDRNRQIRDQEAAKAVFM